MTPTAQANSETGPDPGTQASPGIVIGGAYRIVPEAPLAEFDRPGAPAYVARDQRNPARQLLANVCDPGILPRVETLVQLKTLREALVIPPVAWDPVDWPRASQRCFAVVYEHPEVKPMMSSLSDRLPAAATEFLVGSMLGPLSQTLALIARRGQAHRAISPTNMYRIGETGDAVILGDCVTSPPACGQPTLMETIEVAMTPPMNRGIGGFPDDIYALGASMLFLAIGWCPVAHFNDDQIIESKTRQGSFMALLNGERPPVGLREPLRGMLSDDPAERWTLDDIEQWIGGVMRRSVQPTRDLRSDRPFEFEGGEHRNCRTLARGFGDHSDEAGKVVRSKEFENWLVRGVSDPTLVETVAEILTYSGSQQGESAEDTVVSKVCVALDPLGPLRYKGFIADPQGFGPALASAMDSGDEKMVQLIGDCVSKGIPTDWLKQRALALATETGNVEKDVRRIQQLLKHAGPGYGIERALYEMNPFVPCKSKLLKGGYVYSLRDLLPALEDMVRDTGELPTLVDRHIAAFIAARLKGPTERILTTIDDEKSNSLTSKLGMVKLLGFVQKDYGPEALPNLTGWLSEELAPSIDQFQSRSMREELKRKLESVVAKGQLSALHDNLNSKQLVKRDMAAKKQAAREFAEAALKIEQLISKEFQEDALRTGWGIATGSSVFIAIATIAFLVVA